MSDPVDRIGPPEELDGARILKYAVVTPEVEPTGATRHIVAGIDFGPAAALAIARYPGEKKGYYLFYLDARGVVVTDTWHESLESAVDQAGFEYIGLKWLSLPGADPSA